MDQTYGFFGFIIYLLSFLGCGGGAYNDSAYDSSTIDKATEEVIEVPSNNSTQNQESNSSTPKNFTGTYLFGEQGGTKRGGSLVIEVQKENSLKFELDINIGAPNYNSGTAVGMIKLENNVAIFKTHEYVEETETPCTITFTFNKDHSILVTQNEGSPFSCGFGNNVFADGLFLKQNNAAIFKYEGGF
jgi:hypothetical protein